MKYKISVNLEVSLVEIILSVLIFAVSGAIMLSCFAAARFTQVKANDKVAAGNIVQSDAEMIKSFDDTYEMEEYLADNFKLLKKSGNENIYISYYDKGWNICDEKSKEYSITLKVSDVSVNLGQMKEVNIRAERAESYPFINKSKEKTDYIYEIETSKFFPNYKYGR